MIASYRPQGNIPLHVQIEITWKCNWRCVHCYQDDHSLQNLSLEDIIHLIDELYYCGTMHVIITGGEPLVRKDIFEILRYIRQKGIGITLYTNGHLVNDSMAEELSELVAIAEISLLAGDEHLHDELSRVRGSYKRTLYAINALKKRGVDVIVKTPILKPALHTLRGLKDILEQLGVEWFVDPEISRSYNGDLFPLQYKLSFEELKQFFVDFPEFNPYSGYTADPGISKGLCLAGRQYCFIDALGNVYRCLNFKSACDVQEARGNESAPNMGNIRQE